RLFSDLHSFPTRRSSDLPADYIYIFDPAKEEWIQGPEIPESRRRGSAGLVVHNEKFYIVGGNTVGHNGGYVNWFDEYDPATGVWTVLKNAPRARDHFFTTVVGNKLFAASGRLTGGAGGTFGPVIPQVDVYNFTTNTWSTLPSAQNLPTPRAAAVVANYNDKIIIAGGEVPNNSLALSVVEMYDPVLQTWSTLSSLNHARHGTQGIVSGDGLYVLGGSPVRGGGNQKNMEFFGSDSPQGMPIIASKIGGDSKVIVKKGQVAPIKISNLEGNQSIYIRDITIAGVNASDYKITSGKISNGLIRANTEHEVLVEYIGGSVQSSAVLKIDFGQSSVKEVQLVADGVLEQTTLFLNTGTSADVS